MAWFVMLRSSQGFPLPLVGPGGEDDVVLFPFEEEAKQAARRTMFGEAFGFEIYEW